MAWHQRFSISGALVSHFEDSLLIDVGFSEAREEHPGTTFCCIGLGEYSVPKDSRPSGASHTLGLCSLISRSA